MSSDISRLIFDRKKHYSAVRMQQGRVLMDSDWNAQSDIHLDRLHKQTIDVIGKTGVPVHSNGFQLQLDDDYRLSLSAGRIYVHGLLCELDDFTFMGDKSNTLFIPQEYKAMPHGLIEVAGAEAGRYYYYLEAWQREINYLDDPIIREKALGDPDTTTRLQTIWRVRSQEIDQEVGCEDVQLPWLEISTGKMQARTVDAETGADPCDFNQTSGYTRLENQLYRIQIQSGGTFSDATFKWSRENASVQAKVLEKTGSDVVKIHSLGRDDVLGFSVGDWVELTNAKTRLTRTSTPLMQITEINRNTLEVTLDGNVDGINTLGLKMVRWDQSEQEISLDNEAISIEDGIEVSFTDGEYVAGDYWLIPARTIDSSIEWPWEEPQSPMGVKVFRTGLGIVDVANEKAYAVQDCRKLFPPLTELPEGGQGCCTYHVRPGPNWEDVFSKLDDNENAIICFDVGNYTLERTITLQQKGHLVIKGSGKGTMIDATKTNIAFRIDNCRSLELSDIAIWTGVEENDSGEDISEMMGSITVSNTAFIDLEKLVIRCGSFDTSQNACISLFSNQIIRSARIANCHMYVGHMQNGISVVNAARNVIENNVIFGEERQAVPSDEATAESEGRDPKESAEEENSGKDKKPEGFRKNRPSFFTLTNPNPIVSSVFETVEFNNIELTFDTLPELHDENFWSNLLLENPPPDDSISSPLELQTYLETTVIDMIDSGVMVNPAIIDYFNTVPNDELNLGFQGIVLDGEQVEDVHIVRNRLVGFLQGINVAGSADNIIGTADWQIPTLQSLRIENNYIKNILPSSEARKAFGIFVKNCEHPIIDSNELVLFRAANSANNNINGIDVSGVLGRKGTITNNHMVVETATYGSYLTGIRVHSDTNFTDLFFWNISWNYTQAEIKLDLPDNTFDKYLDTNF